VAVLGLCTDYLQVDTNLPRGVSPPPKADRKRKAPRKSNHPPPRRSVRPRISARQASGSPQAASRSHPGASSSDMPSYTVLENESGSLDGIQEILNQPLLAHDVQEDQEAEQDANSKESWDVIDQLSDSGGEVAEDDVGFEQLREILAASSQTVANTTDKEYRR
jgi:hypothetical protein